MLRESLLSHWIQSGSQLDLQNRYGSRLRAPRHTNDRPMRHLQAWLYRNRVHYMRAWLLGTGLHALSKVRREGLRRKWDVQRRTGRDRDLHLFLRLYRSGLPVQPRHDLFQPRHAAPGWLLRMRCRVQRCALRDPVGMRAVVYQQYGGPDVLRITEVGALESPGVRCGYLLCVGPAARTVPPSDETSPFAIIICST
jgi:hypothetical protein